MTDPVEICVLDRRVRLLHPAEGFRTMMDSVLLAAACPVKAGGRVLDMGSGVGGAAFCVLARVPGCHVTGVEIQAECAELARRNVSLNHAEGRAEFVCSDIRDYTAQNKDHRFDHVICNPPYLEAGTHTSSPHEGRAMALGHGENGMSLDDWLDAGFRLLKSDGSLAMIHRADMIDKIIQGLGARFGAVELIPLWPHAGEVAKRVIIRAVKDRKTPAALHPGLVLHETGGAYTPQADAILRDMKAL